MVLLLANFLLNLLCSVSNCNPKYGYPEDLTLAVGRNDLGSFDAYPVVRTDTGRLRGYTMKAISGRPISAFEGIPYAESPAGVNRFQPPIPKRKWGGIRNAYGVGNVCLQLYTLRGPAVIRGHEDCLFLNIYTLPEAIIGEKKLPVIFFIHGGSYFFGTGSEFGPAYLLEKDVILVTFNYRLGVLGFLSTGDDLVPGNNGLKDQALALKWIYDNIENFGGDPSKITVMGQSAGGASAHFHMLHEETRKYIYAGISMSGTTMQPWAWRTEKARRFLNRGLAKQLNCPLKNDELLRCLKSISPYLVVGAQLRMFPVRTTPIILFAPVIENEGKNSSNVPYITKAPTEVYLTNPPNIPWMVTRTNGEAHLLSLVTKTYGRLGRLGFNYIWKNLGAEFLVIENTAADPQEAIEKLQDHYFKGKGPSQVEESAYDDLITDRFHGLGTHKAIVSHYSTAPTYALLMSGPIRFGLATEVLGSKGASESVIHADDVYVVFNGSTISPPFKSTDPEYRLTEIITGLIVNFVNNGTPSYDPPKLLRSEDLVEWPAVEDPCHVEYLNVTTNSTSITTLPKNTLENYVLWETLNLDDVPKTPKFCQQPV